MHYSGASRRGNARAYPLRSSKIESDVLRIEPWSMASVLAAADGMTGVPI